MIDNTQTINKVVPDVHSYFSMVAQACHHTKCIALDKAFFVLFFQPKTIYSFLISQLLNENMCEY